eukprot:TRINITY_DN3144_c0_g1_i1.p1 TRINITY_DN3144_c0_g1~~TRINITY_DN3144_c0_g1_i1.p1  ORF type:complete len:415 (-),score=74.42 TRINITY_DN3144_c0_g1_i1:132-1208(-)
MTTMSALDTDANSQVKHLMNGRDAADVAAWAHKVNKKYTWTKELHFQRQPSQRPTRADFSDCKDNRCLLKAIKHFYGRLTDKKLVDITWPNGMKLTDADCLKYLINLLGDMHQPLHFGTAETDMGRNITVKFRGNTMSLYDLWDSALTQSVISDSPGFWWGGWTNVGRSRVEFEQDKEAFKTEHEKMIQKWGDDTAKFLGEKIYLNPLTGKQVVDELQNGVFEVKSDLYEAWKREMLQIMLKAGARTAVVLNSILHHKQLKLSGGSAMKQIEGEEEFEKMEEETLSARNAPRGSKRDLPRGRRHHTEGPLALMYNGVIAFVSVFCFLVLMRIWSGPSNLASKQNRQKTRGDGSAKAVL